MAENPEEFIEDELVAPQKSSKGTIVLGVIVLASNLVWAGLLFSFNQSSSAQAAAPPETEVEAVSEKPGPVHTMEVFLVNLNEVDETRYLRVTVNLELADEKSQAEVDMHKVRLRDRMITVLSSQRRATLQKPEDKERLRAMLLKETQDVVGRRPVRALYFSDFIMQ